nr:hypothetical protein [Tanacetum cinerariifolium]
QNEENDKAWEAYVNEFLEADFNQDFEDQIDVALTAEDSLVPAAIPTQHSQFKSKGKEHFTPADVETPTTAATKKKRGRPKKVTIEPSLKPSTKADAKKRKGKEPAYVEASTTAAANKIKGKEFVVQPSTPGDAKKPRGGPKKANTEPSYGRIYYKNRVDTTSCVALFIGFLYQLCFVPFFTKSGDHIVDQLLLCLSLSAVFCMIQSKIHLKHLSLVPWISQLWINPVKGIAMSSTSNLKIKESSTWISISPSYTSNQGFVTLTMSWNHPTPANTCSGCRH